MYINVLLHYIIFDCYILNGNQYLNGSKFLFCCPILGKIYIIVYNRVNENVMRFNYLLYAYAYIEHAIKLKDSLFAGQLFGV